MKLNLDHGEMLALYGLLSCHADIEPLQRVHAELHRSLLTMLQSTVLEDFKSWQADQLKKMKVETTPEVSGT